MIRTAPLPERILGALQVQPMTMAELAQQLGLSARYLERTTQEMHLLHAIHPTAGRPRGRGRPRWVWHATCEIA